jgi:hypothetical protein
MVLTSLAPMVLHLPYRTTSRYIDSKVSGYYGPGAYAAWYITALSSAVRSSQPPPLGSPTFDETDPIDGALLAVVSYPMIASVDLLMRIRGGLQTNARTASLRVVISGWYLAVFNAGICSGALDRPSPKRKLLWTSVCYASIIVMYPGIRTTEAWVSVLFTSFPPLFVFPIPEARHFLHAYTARTKLIILGSCLLLHFLFNAIPMGTMPIFPPSSSKISDLDQAAALVLAVM